MVLKESVFKFSNPWLKELSYKENDSFDIEKDFEGFDGIKAEVKCSNYESKTEAEVSLKLTIGDLSSDNPFCIVVEMAADFSWDEDMGIEPKYLLEKNAPTLLLSYIRPIVANTTSSSKYPTFHIPFMNFDESESEN